MSTLLQNDKAYRVKYLYMEKFREGLYLIKVALSSRIALLSSFMLASDFTRGNAMIFRYSAMKMFSSGTNAIRLALAVVFRQLLRFRQ